MSTKKYTRLLEAAGKAVYQLRSDVTKEERHAIITDLLDAMDGESAWEPPIVLPPDEPNTA